MKKYLVGTTVALFALAGFAAPAQAADPQATPTEQSSRAA